MVEEFFIGLGILAAYFAGAAIVALLLYKFTKVPDEIFRKFLHLILLGSVFVFTYVFVTWWIAALVAIAFMLIVMPIIIILERKRGFSKVLKERKKGEITISLVTVFVMIAGMISLCWGWLNVKYVFLAATLAWGLGDATAALVGKWLGKHHIEGILIQGQKSIEGTVSMFIVSFLAIVLVLIFSITAPWYVYIVVSLCGGIVCALVELFTKWGMDTFTCPFATAVVIIPLLIAFGSIIV